MSCENITYESENNIYEFENILIQHNGKLEKLMTFNFFTHNSNIYAQL